MINKVTSIKIRGFNWKKNTFDNLFYLTFILWIRSVWGKKWVEKSVSNIIEWRHVYG